MKNDKEILKDKLINCLKYFVEEINDDFFVDENNIKTLNDLINHSKIVSYDFNLSLNIFKIVVLFNYDSNSIDFNHSLDNNELHKFINKKINDIYSLNEKNSIEIQLIGLAKTFEEKQILIGKINEFKTSTIKMYKIKSSNYNCEVIFIPNFDKLPIELNIARMNSIIFPEPSVNLNIVKKSPENVDNDLNGYVFIVPLNDLVKIYNRVGDGLFSGNIRFGLEDKMGLEDSMRNTLINEPNMFWYYNNGVTIVSDKDNLEFENYGKIKLLDIWNDYRLGFSVVNGAQTITTASRIFHELNTDRKQYDSNKYSNAILKAKVLLRIITAKDFTKRRNITISLNRQKPVLSEDIAFQSKFISAYNEFMYSLKSNNKDYIIITKRGESEFNNCNVQIDIFAQLVYSCFMNPTVARNSGFTKLYFVNNSEKIDDRYFKDEFWNCDDEEEREKIYRKYYQELVWANKLYKKFSDRLTNNIYKINKLVKSILNNNKWSFVSFILKHIFEFSFPFDNIDYSDLESKKQKIEFVLNNIDEFIKIFVYTVIEIYGLKYSSEISKNQAFWNSLSRFSIDIFAQKPNYDFDIEYFINHKEIEIKDFENKKIDNFEDRCLNNLVNIDNTNLDDSINTNFEEIEKNNLEDSYNSNVEDTNNLNNENIYNGTTDDNVSNIYDSDFLNLFN